MNRAKSVVQDSTKNHTNKIKVSLALSIVKELLKTNNLNDNNKEYHTNHFSTLTYEFVNI